MGGFPNGTPDSLQWIDIIGPADSNEHNFQVKPSDGNGDGFNVYGLQATGTGETGSYSREEVEVMLVHRGEFHVSCEADGTSINETMKDGDIISFPKGSVRNIKALKEGFAYFVVGGDYPAAPKKL
jgi:hypothetical protein